LNNFYNILANEKDEFEQYRKMQENSIEILELSNNLKDKKINIEKIISTLVENTSI